MSEEDYKKIGICESYGKNYKGLNLEAYKKNKKQYDLSILTIASMEISKGYKIYKINNPTKKGTVIKFKRIENESFKKVTDDIKTLLLKKFNENQGG